MNVSNEATTIREVLGSIAMWKNQPALVYVDRQALSQERYASSLINDVALLKCADINIAFACSTDNTGQFFQQAKQYGVKIHTLMGAVEEVEYLVKKLSITKLFIMCESDGVFGRNGLISEFTAQEGIEALKKDFLSGVMRDRVQTAVDLCTKGVKRVHFVNAKRDGALLEEFLTSKGRGSMVYGNALPYKMVRKAVSKDIVTITSIMRSTVNTSISEEVMNRRLSDITVFSVDDIVHAVLVVARTNGKCIVEYLVHSGEFRSHEALNRLLEEIESEVSSHTDIILIDPKRAPKLIGIQPWFLRRGYVRNDSKQEKSYYKWWKKKLSN